MRSQKALWNHPKIQLPPQLLESLFRRVSGRALKGWGQGVSPVPPNLRASHHPQVPSGFVWLMGPTGVLAD